MTTLEYRKSHREAFKKLVAENKTNIDRNTLDFNGYSVGQEVSLYNGYGLEVGPFTILGFSKEGKMYLDWDCYWFPVPTSRIIKHEE